MIDARHHEAVRRSARASASLQRIRLVAGHTLGEALHLRLTILLGLTGAGLTGGVFWLRDFNFGSAELKFIGDFGLGVLGFFGTMLAVLATAHLFFHDVESGAASCVLARPVRRWEYLAGKFAGVAGILALFTASLGLLLAGLLIWRGTQIGANSFALRAFIAACGMVWLKNTLVAVLTLLVCSYAGSALFASCAGLLLALAGHLRTFAHGDGWLGLLRFWPNLGLFDGGVVLAAGQPPQGLWLAGLAAYWAAYVLLFGGIASYVFRHREF